MNKPASLFKKSLNSALSVFVTQTEVTKISILNQYFYLVELSGEKLKEAKWVPGGKVQIKTGTLSFRTYTPIKVDKDNGRLTFLCYRRDGNIGTNFIEALRVGDSCDVFGPRESLDFSSIEGRVALFGDETSLGIARVLQSVSKDTAHIFLETTVVKEAQDVLEKIEVHAPTIEKKNDDQSHLQKMGQAIVALYHSKSLTKIFLTGRASSIQVVRKILKDSGIPNTKIDVRVYWADGKKGLD